MKSWQRPLGRLIVLAAALAALSGGGCGSGSGGPALPVTACPTNVFVPNYADNLDRLLNWSSFPVTIYFIRDGNWTQQRQNIALAGFNQWVSATGSAITYQVVATQASSDVQVRFDPATMNGVTNLTFTDFTMENADMHIGVEGLQAADIQCIAAHEFGHALGIDGHSPNPADLMNAVHTIGTACPITQEDLNTLKTGYCSLFGVSPGRVRPRPSGRSHTITIQ